MLLASVLGSGVRSLLTGGIRSGVMMTADSIGAIRVRFEEVLVPQSVCTEFLTCLLLFLCSGGVLFCLLPRPVWLVPCVSKTGVRGEFRLEYKS